MFPELSFLMLATIAWDPESAIWNALTELSFDERDLRSTMDDDIMPIETIRRMLSRMREYARTDPLAIFFIEFFCFFTFSKTTGSISRI